MWSRRKSGACRIVPPRSAVNDILQVADVAEDVPDEVGQHRRLAGDAAVGRDLPQPAHVLVGQGKRRREVRDDVGVVDVAGGARAEVRVEGGREGAIADPGRSERAHAGGRGEAVGGQGGERRAEAVAAEPDGARPRQRRQLLDERRPDPLEGVPEPCMDRPCVACTSAKRASSIESTRRSGSVPRKATMTAPGIEAT